jgi:tRNA (guanine37-N1)-methyltransferase
MVVEGEVESWALVVGRRHAEETRRRLLGEGLLDGRLRPHADGDAVVFALNREIEGAVRRRFISNPEPEELPRHELVGGIAIMQEADPAAAERLLSSRPSLHTVLAPEGPVEGVYRTRRFTVLAGEPVTRTVCTEYGMRFSVDLAVAYFSARLSTERQRVLARMRPGETVLDMFAGVGPFAITLAPAARLVVAVDLNPDAVGLMAENIRKNRRINIIPVLADASHLPGICPRRFDRVIMNLPMGAAEFLGAAFALCRPGGEVQFYTLQERAGEYTALIEEQGGRIAGETLVRTYSPASHHAVYDVVVP